MVKVCYRKPRSIRTEKRIVKWIKVLKSQLKWNKIILAANSRKKLQRFNNKKIPCKKVFSSDLNDNNKTDNQKIENSIMYQQKPRKYWLLLASFLAPFNFQRNNKCLMKRINCIDFKIKNRLWYWTFHKLHN